ncbi:MAG: prephenate dehydrogenase/arogenate dehydrogenase family protein, partial [Gammaproteobacteria bacterium]|nr:prephenate dehydrogenase/arogenate dehydrogenase family protein [Gammaproteobacteria bacterium]
MDKTLTATTQINRLVVVGLGLIGASFAKGVRDAGLAHEVVGVDLNAQACERAVELGIADRCTTELAEACVGADVVMLAVPVLALKSLLMQLAALQLEHTIITDAGSVKGHLLQAAQEAFGHLPPLLVLGHPIAGSERSGVDAANPDLFKHHKVILTPHAKTDPEALICVQKLWQGLGADVESMSVEQHDRVLAATSHLPHLLAFGLVDSLAKRSENLEIFRYAAGGFRDFTRIAGSDPLMWHDIFLANREAVLEQLDQYRDDLDELRQAIAEKDGRHLLGVFTRA